MLSLSLLLGLAATAGLPPIFRPDEVVLFQGDSITDGNRGRSADPNHILGHGYVFSIASRYGATYAADRLTFINKGISGNTVSDLAKRWKEDTLALKPTVLSVLVGINEIWSVRDSGKDIDIPAFESKYDQLLAEAKLANPQIRLVLCEPFTLDTGNGPIAWRKRNVEAMAAAVGRLATKYHAPAINFQRVFDAATKLAPANHWIWDGIHPTYSGHELMAQEWIRAYNEFYVSPLEDPARNSAIDPVVNSERDSYDWLHRHRDILDYGRTHSPKLVLIGDSITHFWSGEPTTGQKNGPKAWQEFVGDYPTMNMGCGWDRTQNVLWRLQHGQLDGVQPKHIVLNIGTNNLVGDETARTNTPEEVAVGIRKVVEALQKKCPSAEIVVMGVFPRGWEKDNDLDLRIRRLNGILATALRTIPGARFLDIGPELRGPDGAAPRELFGDGTHPTEAGYRIWGAALRKAGVLP